TAVPMGCNRVILAAGALGAAFAITAPGTATAETCGGADAACTLPAGSYHLLSPAGDGPHPAVMLLHDAGGSAAQLMGASSLLDSALARGFAVIVPQALDQAMADGSVMPGWGLSGTRSGGRDDITFIERVIADSAEQHGIDASRILVTGYGHGAALTWEAACARPEAAAAFAPRNGGYFAALPEACAGDTAVLHMHAPVEGGWPLATPGETAEGAAPFVPIQDHLTLAAAAFGCEGRGGSDLSLPAGWDGVAWSGCAEGASLSLVLHPESARTSALQLDVMLDWFEATLPPAAPAPEEADLVDDAQDVSALSAETAAPVEESIE
ncbi:MAG: dienelactone hydrolase family protein, partial [Pseudomonadota bacterium]